MGRDAADPGTGTCSTSPAHGGAYDEVAYFAGNSLGLQPKATQGSCSPTSDAWARLGVEGHLEARPARGCRTTSC